MAMDGATAPQRGWTVRDGASATAMDCDCNGDGWQRTVRWQLDGYGWRSATAMDGMMAMDGTMET